MIRFRMAQINVDQFAILADTLPHEGLSYTLNIGFSGAPEAKRLACAFSIEFKHYESPILKLGIICEFDIHKEDWDSCTNGDIITISKEHLGFFANQTVGTARGILFCKTEGTDFRKLILPPVDLTKLLDDDLVIGLQPNSISKKDTE